MNNKHPRLVRESRTIAVMVEMYCKDNHRQPNLCAGCRELMDYSAERLEKCPFQEGKTTCVKCKVHCYQKEMRERVRVVMRYAGPRMLLKHPALAIFHLIDGARKEPVKKK